VSFSRAIITACPGGTAAVAWVHSRRRGGLLRVSRRPGPRRAVPGRRPR
jgi:hypothetical protein